jgi:hypothetical protein
MILFLVPETRFDRDLTQVEDVNPNHPQENVTDEEDPMEKDNAQTNEFELAPSPTAASTIPPKKSQLQLLAFCSGVPKEMNLLELFLRPFPLIAYPAVLWATLACQYSSLEELLSLPLIFSSRCRRAGDKCHVIRRQSCRLTSTPVQLQQRHQWIDQHSQLDR